MSSHKVFLYSAVLFLCGVLFKSIGLSSAIVLMFVMLVCLVVIYSFIKQSAFIPAVLLPVFLLLGAVHYQWDHSMLEKHFVAAGPIATEAVVISNPTYDQSTQQFYIQLENSESNIVVKARKHPAVEYGDKVHVEGVIEQVAGDSSYDMYLYKNKVVGRMFFPENIRVVSKNKASPIRYGLYSLRNNSERIFQKLFTPIKAALINGLTLGGYSGFTDEFRGAMERSGTTHLVALSGYNISILVWVSMAFFVFFFRKRTAILITLLLIAGFVIMTGAESSVVRAAIMGSLVVAASYFGRFYDLKNAVVCAALCMVLFNPKVLVFDVGFQLSFLALLGIVYIKPILDSLFGFYDSGFLAWKDNLTVTTAAQIAVFPLLMVHFEYFSLTSIIANIAILEFIPITMALGFFLLLFYFISYPFTLVISWITGMFLSLEIGIIEFFSTVSIPVVFSMSWTVAILYYCLLVGGVYFLHKRVYV